MSDKSPTKGTKRISDSEKTSVSKAIEDCRDYFKSRNISASFEHSQKPGYVVLNVGEGVRIIYNYKKLRKFSLHTHYRQQVIIVDSSVTKTPEEIVDEIQKSPDNYPYRTAPIEEQRGKPDETQEDLLCAKIVTMYNVVLSQMQRTGAYPVPKTSENPYLESFRQRHDTQIDSVLEEKIIGIPVRRNNIIRKIKLSELSECIDPTTGTKYAQESLENAIMIALSTQVDELKPIDYHSLLMVRNRAVFDLGSKKSIVPYLSSVSNHPSEDDVRLVLGRFESTIYDEAAKISDEDKKKASVRAMRLEVAKQSSGLAGMLKFLHDKKDEIIVYELANALDKDNIGPFLNYVFPEHGTTVIGHADNNTAPLIIGYVAKMRGSVPFDKAIDRDRYCIRVNSRTIYFTGKFARHAFSEYTEDPERKADQALADNILAVMDRKVTSEGIPDPVAQPVEDSAPEPVEDSPQYQTRAYMPEQPVKRMEHVIISDAELPPQQPEAPAPVRPRRERQRSQTLLYGTPVEFDAKKDYDALMSEIDAKLSTFSDDSVTDINGKKK